MINIAVNTVDIMTVWRLKSVCGLVRVTMDGWLKGLMVSVSPKVITDYAIKEGHNKNPSKGGETFICHLKGLLKTLSYKINFRAHKYFSSSFPSSTRVTLGSDVTLHPYGHSVFINV